MLTYVSMDAYVAKTLIYGFPCSHILAACHFRLIGFRSFVQHYYTMQSYFNTWAPLFNPIHNEYEWLPYVGPVIVLVDLMKRVSGGRPKSTCLQMKWMLEKVKPQLHVVCANKVVTIVVLVQIRTWVLGLHDGC